MPNISHLRQYYDELLFCGDKTKIDKNHDSIFQNLIKAYSEEHREYHTLHHLEDLFGLLEIYGTNLSAEERLYAIAFILWHDYVYRTSSKEAIATNELKSSHQMRNDFNALGLGLDISYLEKLIIASQRHDLDSEDVLGALLLDMDMSILGRDDITYDAYRRKVRKEFKDFSDEIFFIARRDMFLVPTLQKQRIFITDAFEEDFGELAKHNIQREIGLINAAYHS